jgi:hypothetical protein
MHLHTTAALESCRQSEQAFLQMAQYPAFLLPRRQLESEVATNLGECESPSLTWCLSFLHAFHIEPSPQWHVGTYTSQRAS